MKSRLENNGGHGVFSAWGNLGKLLSGNRTKGRLAGVLALIALLAPLGVVRAVCLPQSDPYQVTLRDYLASLKEEDFALTPLPENDLTGEQRLMKWLPGRLGEPWALTRPPSDFLLTTIEGDPKSVLIPSGIGLARLARDTAPHPVPSPRPMRLRAFVIATIDLLMLDQLHGSPAGASVRRSDFLGGTLIWMAYAYREAKNDLPQNVRAAYETGLKKMVARLQEWGPKNLHTNMELFAPVGLAYAAQAVNDPETHKAAKDYTTKLFSDPRNYNPAGFFLEEGGFDATYNGISLFFSTWAGLITDWDFVKQALNQNFKLRAHLSLPDAAGSRERHFFGPSHFNTRTSGDSPSDQWGWNDRNYGAAMMTEYALPLLEWPDEVDFQRESTRLAKLRDKDADPPRPWKEDHWIRADLTTEYPKGDFFNRITALRAEDSPLLKSPYEKPGHFVERFGDSFVIAKFDTYAVILFTGAVVSEYQGKPRGFGGGNLSAFWTPESGPVVLGRSRGNQGKTHDQPEDWRVRPVHSISGQTANGKMFTSARCLQPEVSIHTTPESLEVTVSGTIATNPVRMALRGTMTYQREFRADASGIEVESSVKVATPEEISDLCEVIPLFLRDERFHRTDKGTLPVFTVQFFNGSEWSEAGVEVTENVRTVRVTRAGGVSEIHFDKPASVRLSPEDWVDDHQTRAVCRNLLVDFPRNAAAGEPFDSSLKYRIVPAGTEKPAPRSGLLGCLSSVRDKAPAAMDSVNPRIHSVPPSLLIGSQSAIRFD